MNSTTIPTTSIHDIYVQATRLYQDDYALPRFVTIIEKDGKVAYSFHN